MKGASVASHAEGSRRNDPSGGGGFDRYAEIMPINQVNAAFHCSSRLGFVYVSVPKAACSTLKLTLQRMEVDDPGYQPKQVHDRKNSPLAGIYDLGEDGMEALLASDSVLVFSFVRNPYTRLLSAYLDKIARLSPGRRDRLAGLGLDPELPPNALSFPSFVQRVAEQRDYDMDPHWRPQTRQLMLERISYDFIGRVETFDEDLERLDKLLSGRVSACYTPRARHATNAQALLRQHYDRQTKRLVRQRYASDFEALGYDRLFKSAVQTTS